ncbi:MAG: hypothetical protein KGJ10_08330 [Acidobacteriota bacterium]|nr:hypothetical protein [Acidobacteriota bacterium]MDE3044809.1 hypothetical protein [Acidobacteriota bacterium]
MAKRIVVGFGRFWWDFLVGDTPELFVAVVAVLVVIALVSVAAGANTWAVALLPVMVIGALATSVRRAANKRP